MSLSVVILSKASGNLLPCVDAVRKHEPHARLIVVDDGLDIREPHAEYVMGAKPFNYSRNANIGIIAAGGDVVLLNDDALLETPGGFSAMQRLAAEHREYGIIASTANVIGQASQWRMQGDRLREERKMVCFVCVLIPVRTLATVGLLDERYGPQPGEAEGAHYGCDDDDYCRRVREAGLKIGIYDGCYVDHGSLRSTYRGDPLATAPHGPSQVSREIFRQKWGEYPR